MTISAVVIADSIGEHAPRLTTLQLRYPKFIHGEFMTHRVFSRNASSSRAIPVERLIKDVFLDPVEPTFWGKNQPGMSAREEHNDVVFHPTTGAPLTRDDAWDRAKVMATAWAAAFSQTGYHKQIVNRLLEPFCHINVVVTATEWSNFFALRCHPDAQPEMRELAEAMRYAMDNHVPKTLEICQWHLPFVHYYDEGSMTINQAIRCSVARCARVSYLTQEGKHPSIEDDLKLYDYFVASVPLHASPAEHQATPDELVEFEDPFIKADIKKWRQPHLHNNLRGWVQYRKTLPGESQ